jgi:uncharacterized protein
MALVMRGGWDGASFDRRVRMPVVWTRRWGLGRVFVSMIGRRVQDLISPPVRELTVRGLCWAARHQHQRHRNSVGPGS